MKTCIIAFVIAVAFASVKADLTDEQIDMIKERGHECMTETSVDEELVKSARKGTFTKDTKLEEFTLCLSKKTGFQNDDGEIQTEVIREKLSGALNDPEAASQLISKCEVSEETPAKTAFQAYKCYYENTPADLTLF